MAIKPEVLDALLAAGATAEMIVAAVKADLASDEGHKAEKRANNAERQRRFKSRRNAEVTLDNAGNALPDVTPSLSPFPSPQTPQPNPHTHPDNNTRTRKGPVPAKPDGVKTQTWTDFVDLRKRKRAPLTETALDGIRDEAEKAGWPLETALAKCLARGWQGFEADWVKGEKPANGTAPPSALVANILARKAREASP